MLCAVRRRTYRRSAIPEQPLLALVDPRAEDASSALEDASSGQLPLFVLPETRSTPTLVKPGIAPSDVGEAGEAWFEGVCRAWSLPILRAGRGQIGPDFMVNGHRVQVKATASIQRDGLMYFHAGSHKRFIDYAGLIDMFAFVYVGRSDHFGRSRIITANALYNRCKGQTAKMHPFELPIPPVLDLLVLPRD